MTVKDLLEAGGDNVEGLQIMVRENGGGSWIHGYRISENAGGIESYYEMYEHGNYYYCFDLKNGTRRYWTNLSEESAEILGISIRE